MSLQEGDLDLPTAAVRLTALVALGMWSGLVPEQATGHAQDGASPTFRSGVSLVVVSATVRGPDDRLLTNLVPGDFRISVGGRPVAVDTFDTQRLPLQMVVLFSPTAQLSRTREAGDALIEAMESQDEATIGSALVEVAISPVHTNDRQILRRIVREELWLDATPHVGTAVGLAIDRIERAPGRRAVLVIGTDIRQSPLFCAANSPPCITVDEAERRALAQDVVVYGVRFPAPARWPNDRPARQLARSTGGGYVVVQDSDDLPRLMSEILGELRHQYTLGFGLDTRAYRQDQVEVTTTRPGGRVQARFAIDGVVVR